jgi:poly-gamma-glutamate synthesis protein (capsule biosynthesis protein)
VNNLIFNCRPEYVAEAAKYFNILDLANNHTDNVGGAAGLASTRTYLDQAGIQHFGNFDPNVANDICEVVALPVRVVGSDKQSTPGALPVAFCAWHYFSFTPKAGQIEAMKAYSDAMPVFAFVHMGAEYNKVAQAGQVAIAHQVADQNPEFVIANNPHWVQNTEVYKGKLIVYSTGNFIFDQLDKEGMQSASIDATMTLPEDEHTAEWLRIGADCKMFHDDCLAKILAAHLPKPKLQFKYAVVAGDNSGKLTKKGDAALQAAIEQRTNWAQTAAALGQ